MASDISKHALLNAIINEKIRIVVKNTELPEVYSISSNNSDGSGNSNKTLEGEFNKAGCMIPPFEVDDYIPGTILYSAYMILYSYIALFILNISRNEESFMACN